MSDHEVLSNWQASCPQPRPEVLATSLPVHGGIDEEEIAQYRLQPETILDFSTNTNPFGPSPKVRAAIQDVVLERYPDPDARALRRALAKKVGLSPDSILPGNGVSELISLVAQAFLRPDDAALVMAPTFGEYSRAAALAGAKVATCMASERDGFVLDTDAVNHALNAIRPRVVFLCNPNNPTGQLVPRENIASWVRRNSGVLFVVDEAYLPFVAEMHSALPLGKNVLILRSMTKDLGLAGLRLGYAVAHPELILALVHVRPSWNVNALAQAAGLAALDDEEHWQSSLPKMHEAKVSLMMGLEERGFRPVPSTTNFFLLPVDDGAAFRRRLLYKGILVRDCASFGLPAHVRIAVRKSEENAQFLAALERSTSLLLRIAPEVIIRHRSPTRTAHVLMIQGTSSSVGKSLLVAALCRIYARRGWRVVPFKAQNMSNNAAVCHDGAEIGRAQAFQALAAGVEPTADMNPILLKPEGNSRSQVIVRGKHWKTLSAGDYYKHKCELWPIATSALDALRRHYDLVIIEGAGSPVELNLRRGDIVNMAIARHASAPVVLVGDIDRGGIFAQLLGTLMLLESEDRARIRGIIVNKFRGDLSLFAEGIRLLEERGNVAVFGTIPYIDDLILPEEDATALADSANRQQRSEPGLLDLAVIQLPHIANFDDFDPFRGDPGVRIRYVSNAGHLGRPDAIILAGTKSTMADLAWLEATGLAMAVRQLAAETTAVVGICGGYQMLGRRLLDPHRIESPNSEMPGLGLLPVETVFVREKATFQVRARIQPAAHWLGRLAGHDIAGYEIHMGRTASESSWLEITQRNGVGVIQPDGAITADGRIWGCYLHGLFADERFRRSWMKSLRPQATGQYSRPGVVLNETLDRLADAVESNLNMKNLDEIIRP